MVPFFRALTLLCLALPAASAEDILHFQEEHVFSKQLYTQITGNPRWFVAELPGEALEIQSLADPMNPVVIGRIPVTQAGLGLVMVENRVLRLTVDALQVFDVTNPAKPVLAHSYSLLPGMQPSRIQTVGQQVYVAGPHSDKPDFVLQTIALDASAPMFRAVSFQSASVAHDPNWLVNETGLFILEEPNLWVFDLEIPTLAVNRRQHETGIHGFYWGMAFFRDQVVVLSEQSVHLFNPRDVKASRTFSSAGAPGPHSLVIGDLFYSFTPFGIHVYDFSREENPFLDSFYAGGWSRFPMYDAQRDQLFDLGIEWMHVYDNPTAVMNTLPNFVRIRDGLYPFDDVAVNGELVALSSHGMVTLLRQLPEGDFEELTSLRTGLFGHDLMWFGDFLIAGGGVDYRLDTTYIINVQDPQNPVIVGDFSPRLLSRDGNRIARLDRGTMSVLIQDFSNPLQPKTQDFVSIPIPSDVFSFDVDNILLAGDFLFLSNLVNIRVFQKSEGRYQFVTNLNMVSDLRNGPFPETMMFHENKLFVGGSAVTVVDMTDPQQPRIQGSVSLNDLSVLAYRPRFVGVLGDTLFYLSEGSLFVVDFEDPDNLGLVPFALDRVSALRIQDGVMAAGLYIPTRLVTGEVGFCTPPEITDVPVDTFLCPDGSATLSTVASGEGLAYQWYRDGELLEGADEAALTIADLQQTMTYVCHVTSACATVETEAVQVIPTVCQVDQAFGRWQSDRFFCETQNPSVLAFVAALNNGGSCPR